MNGRKGYYRTIPPRPVNTTSTALANLRPQLADALSNAEHFKGKDDITTRRHAEHAERLQTEIAELKGWTI